jgi:hypothetical protein
MKTGELLERLLGIPALLVGAGLMYVGYFEAEVLYVFFYFLLGFGIFVAGGILLLGGIPSPGRREPLQPTGEVYRVGGLDRVEEPGTPEPVKEEKEFCTNCGAPLTSAGKFCGSCGAPIKGTSPAG